MSDSINTTATGGNTTQTQGDNKTFSQDDVNRIIGERLAKEKSKNEADLAKKEQELAQRELALDARELLTSKGLPVELYEALNATSKETLDQSIQLIEKAFSKAKSGHPNITIKGASPANGGGFDIDAESASDKAIRKTMGLT